MKAKNRFIKAAAASFAALICLSGCSYNAGNSSSSANSGSTDNSGNTSSGGGANGNKESVIVWVPEDVVALTQKKLDEWLGTQSDFNGKYQIKVSAMGEGDAATQMLTDVEAGADIYSFAQDQLARLVTAGALSAPGGKFLENVRNNNDEGSVGASTLDGKIYAYPETSDNGYFLYYDKSVVTDPSTLEGILDQCKASNKKLYMDLQSGWYSASFFFATGAECYYNYDKDGKVTGAVCDYSSDKGLKAMKAMVYMTSHPSYSQSTGSDAALFDPNGGTAGAVISGVWDSATISDYLGENFGATKLPTFTVDGEAFQMSGFGGFKLVGVKPQTNSDKLTFCHLAADYLTGEEMQTERFENNNWGPSNTKVQASDKVKANPALSALAQQLKFCIPQGQYPNAFWTLSEAFGTDINSKLYKDADDETLKKALADYEKGIKEAK